MSENKLEFRLGTFGKFIPVIIAVIFIVLAAVQQSNVSGYVVAFFMAIVLSILFVKNEKVYGEAIISGLSRPIFGIISLAVIMAAIADKFASSSGLIQTLASFVIKANITGGLFAAISFLIACMLSLSTGTSVGTNIIVIPILFPVGVMAGVSPGFMVGALVSGAAFGDNLAPISDTTIASAGSQGADMGGVVRSRMKYSIPVAVFTFIILGLFAGGGVITNPSANVNTKPLSLVMLIVPTVIIAFCLMRKHLLTALSAGITAGFITGLATGIYKFEQILSFPGGFKVEGLLIEAVNGSMGTVAMLFGVFALLGIMEKSGLIESIGAQLIKLAKGVRGTEATIVGSIAVMGLITGVTAVGMVALGDIIKNLGEKVGLDKYRRANLMDCAAISFCFLAPWVVHTVLPAQLASGMEGMNIVPTDVLTHNVYSIGLVAMLIIAIITGYGRHTKLPNVKAEQ